MIGYVFIISHITVLVNTFIDVRFYFATSRMGDSEAAKQNQIALVF